MKRFLLPVLFTGVVCFAAGGVAGFFAGKTGSHILITELLRSLREEVEESEREDLDSGDFQSPLKEGEWKKPGVSYKETFPEKPHEKNPFAGQPPARLLAVLNGTKGEQHGEVHHLATEALLELARRDPLSVASLLPMISRHGPMHQVCRELVLHGGEEGMYAVLDFILDKNGSIEMRAEAMHALGALPPEARELGMAGLLELSGQLFPRELQHSLCNALGEISGSRGVSNLLGLLKAEGSRIRPDIVLDTIGRIGEPEDTQRLLSLLNEGSWTHELQTAILRSAACVGRNGDFLLDLITSGEGGPSIRVIAQALCDSAPRIDLDPEKLMATLKTDLPPEVRGNLARALIRSRGDGGMERFLELASDQSSGIDADSLGAALAESGQRELVPAMTELLGDIKDPETLHRLTRSIVETGGRDGVEALLSLLEERSLTGHHLHPLCGSIAEAGAPEDADRLFQLLEGVRHPEGARALLKAAVSLSGEEGLDRCLGLLQESKEGDVRAAAADLIGHMNAADHIPQLLDGLAREDFGRAQWQLTQAIARAGDEGIEGLTEFLRRDQNEHRKHEILSSLSYMENFDATPVLSRTLFEDHQPRIREHAAEILSRIGNEPAILTLTEALQREQDAGVKNHITKLLSKALERRG